MGDGSTHASPKDYTIWPEEWHRQSKKQMQERLQPRADEKTRLQEARRKRKSSTFHPVDRIPSGDFRSFRISRNMRGSFTAVFSEERCPVKLQALNVNNRVGIEENLPKHMDHVSEKDTRPTSIAVWLVA